MFVCERVSAAASSNLRVMFVTGFGWDAVPPASDRSMTFSPFGPTRRMSTSVGYRWKKLVSVAVTFVIVPPRLATLIVEGYGEAGPLGLIVMGLELVKLRDACPPRVKAKLA